MSPFDGAGHPVLRYLAVMRAARDFGLGADELQTLALRFQPGGATVDELADAAAAVLLGRRRPS